MLNVTDAYLAYWVIHLPAFLAGGQSYSSHLRFGAKLQGENDFGYFYK